MPQADFTALFSDPNLVDSFMVQRRSAHVDEHGRSQPIVVWTRRKTGVVTATGPSDLVRTSDMEYQPNAISIATPFPLQGPDPAGRGGQQPDQIIWHNEIYVVTSINDLTGFGRGFVLANAERIQATSLPPQVSY